MDLTEREAIAIANFALNMPEIKCNVFDSSVRHCIDYRKALRLSDLLSANDDINELYYSYLGNSRIIIGSTSGLGDISYYNNLRLDEHSRGVYSYYAPVLVYYAESDYYDFGWLHIMVGR